MYQAYSAAKETTSSRTSWGKHLNCEVDLPASWEASVIEGSIPTVTTEGQVLPTSVGADGTVVFGQLETGIDKATGAPLNREIVQLDREKKSWSTVYQMEHPNRDQQVDGSFDGRWLVFAVQHSLGSYHDWSVHAWDNTTGKTREIDEDAGIQGPLIYVDTVAGKAVWTKAVAQNITEAYLYDLATNKKTVVARGNIGAAWIVGDLIVWPEVSSSGDLEFRAAALDSGTPVKTPRGLDRVGKIKQIAASGSALAWIEGEFTTIRAWKIGWDEPRTIFDEGRDKAIDDIDVSGDLVSWHTIDNGQPVYIGDMRTGSCVRLSERGGYVETGKDAMIVVYPDSAKQKYGSFVLRPSHLSPLPRD
ncbi:hypothetical protein ACFY05_26650 [Microtetraspora fusca]|uniref:WD40 repeat domain-containing protein n=1 Tax=Microtetraspora fusca TaxID=1997 RepID=A0ABW6VAS8_MICFU